MVRVSIAAALVFCLASVAVAGGNGSVKITGFTDLVNPPDDPKIDGVGVLSFAKGTGETSLHVILSGLIAGETYEVRPFSDTVFEFDLAGTASANNGGNLNFKESGNPLLGNRSESIDLIEIWRNGDSGPVAVWMK